jgi:hypothetical protein
MWEFAGFDPLSGIGDIDWASLAAQVGQPAAPSSDPVLSAYLKKIGINEADIGALDPATLKNMAYSARQDAYMADQLKAIQSGNLPAIGSGYAETHPQDYYNTFGTIPINSLGSSRYGIDPNTWATDTAKGAAGMEYLTPDATATYTLYSPRTGQTLGSGVGAEGLLSLAQMANNQTLTKDRKADWQLIQTPADGSAPQVIGSNLFNSDLTALGKIVATGLPIAAAFIPGIGSLASIGLSAAAGGLGAAMQDKDILTGALMSAAPVAGSSFLGPVIQSANAAGQVATSLGKGLGAAIGSTGAGLATGQNLQNALIGGALSGLGTYAGNELGKMLTPASNADIAELSSDLSTKVFDAAPGTAADAVAKAAVKTLESAGANSSQIANFITNLGDSVSNDIAVIGAKAASSALAKAAPAFASGIGSALSAAAPTSTSNNQYVEVKGQKTPFGVDIVAPSLPVSGIGQVLPSGEVQVTGDKAPVQQETAPVVPVLPPVSGIGQVLPSGEVQVTGDKAPVQQETAPVVPVLPPVSGIGQVLPSGEVQVTGDKLKKPDETAPLSSVPLTIGNVTDSGILVKANPPTKPEDTGPISLSDLDFANLTGLTLQEVMNLTPTEKKVLSTGDKIQLGLAGASALAKALNGSGSPDSTPLTPSGGGYGTGTGGGAYDVFGPRTVNLNTTTGQFGFDPFTYGQAGGNQPGEYTFFTPTGQAMMPAYVAAPAATSIIPTGLSLTNSLSLPAAKEGGKIHKKYGPEEDGASSDDKQVADLLGYYADKIKVPSDNTAGILRGITAGITPGGIAVDVDKNIGRAHIGGGYENGAGYYSIGYPLAGGDIGLNAEADQGFIPRRFMAHYSHAFSEGGEADDDMVKHLVEWQKGGGHAGPGQVKGIGSGQEDKIPAWLSDGEYVWSAQDVADLGDGSTDEGVRRLDKMRHMVRRRAGRKDVKKIAKPQQGIDTMLKAVGGSV